MEKHPVNVFGKRLPGVCLCVVKGVNLLIREKCKASLPRRKTNWQDRMRERTRRMEHRPILPTIISRLFKLLPQNYRRKRIDMYLHRVQARNGTVFVIKGKREFGAAQDYRFNSVALFHSLNDRNKFADGGIFYDSKFKFVGNPAVHKRLFVFRRSYKFNFARGKRIFEKSAVHRKNRSQKSDFPVAAPERFFAHGINNAYKRNRGKCAQPVENAVNRICGKRRKVRPARSKIFYCIQEILHKRSVIASLAVTERAVQVYAFYAKFRERFSAGFLIYNPVQLAVINRRRFRPCSADQSEFFQCVQFVHRYILVMILGNVNAKKQNVFFLFRITYFFPLINRNNRMKTELCAYLEYNGKKVDFSSHGDFSVLT